MPIVPLPQFEADLAEQDRELYEKMKPPTSVVVRFGIMQLVGEFPFQLDVKPGCGTKFVVRTHRGTEIAEMLTSTCPNAGCSKSVSRKEMLEYIENSGGKDYPFFSMQGKVLRVATVEDLNQQTKIDEMRPQMVRQARAIVERMQLPAKIIDAEPILGGEKITFYFGSEDRIDFRELVQELASIHHTRIEMRQIGARDEARLVADYEKCGQHCCCKQFLKVLKPVSMKAAKIQKATLDPLKISGRCGRLMCCLRYEEQTYDDLRARLPKKRTRVQSEHGVGFVLDSQILTQLILVQLEDKDEQVAVPLEELTILGPGEAPKPMAPKKRENVMPEFAVGEDEGEGEQAEATADQEPQNQLPQNRPPQDRPRPEQRGPDRGPRPQGGPGGPGRPPRDGDRRPSGRPGGPGGQGGRDQRPRDQRGGGGGQGRGPQSGPPQQRPPQDRPRPESRPAPGGPPKDELDEIMDMLEGGGGAGGEGRRSGPPERNDGPDGGRRRRRRRRGGPGGPGGPGGGGGPQGPSGEGGGAGTDGRPTE